MRITPHQLKKIIRASLLKEEMLKIISNKHSPETEIFNRIANYALNNDIEGALADSKVNTPDLDLDIDEMGEWVHRVGAGGNWLSADVVVPDNWDADVVYDFMNNLLNAWYDQGAKDNLATHQSSPDTKEREALGAAFTMDFLLPTDIPGITYQLRRKAGQVVGIDLETDDDRTSINASSAIGYGTTIDDISRVLDKGGARLRKKRPPVRHQPPMYD